MFARRGACDWTKFRVEFYLELLAKTEGEIRTVLIAEEHGFRINSHDGVATAHHLALSHEIQLPVARNDCCPFAAFGDIAFGDTG